MKSVAEGSEIRLTWPATVPGTAGKVTSVSTDKIETQLVSGRKQAYRLGRKNKSTLIPYVLVGDEFGDDDTVIASVISTLVPIEAPRLPQYDFIADLRSEASEDVYVAVKALGHLSQQSSRSADHLLAIAKGHDDGRIKLEAAASLARLGIADGWTHIEALANNPNADVAYRMETTFILAEFTDQRAVRLLTSIANSAESPSELRAAAAWGLSASPGNLTTLLPLTSDPDEMTAVHAIVGASRLIDQSNIAAVLHEIGNNDRQAAGLVRSLLSSESDFLPELARQLQQTPAGRRRQWLLYLFAAAGQPKGEPYIGQLSPEMRAELDFYWSHHANNWTNRLDVADQINFLEQQTT